MRLMPQQISLSKLKEKKSLSSSNYAEINILNENKSELREFLLTNSPFQNGEEPGSFTYVPKSNVSFLRNSCIDNYSYSNQIKKEIFLNPKYEFNSDIEESDILLCKDANIGDACLFIPDIKKEYVLSSGVVKLNFSKEEYKYYCLAFFRDEYFRHQLDALTPKGSTIRHAGTKFLNCNIPSIDEDIKPLLPLFEALIKNIAYSERESFNKLCEANAAIENEFKVKFKGDVNPTVNSFKESLRLDAGFYSETVLDINTSLDLYQNGTITFNDAGFKMKRGPNLQKRDLGRSIKSKTYKKNYHLLVYPSDISDNGYILKQVYIGARNPVWYMRSGDILFSAEGTVGKVFVICEEDMKFITNIHGLIITPNEKLELQDSIMLGQYLHYLRSIGYFDKVSVGGQGGSYAINYWEDFKIPNFDKSLKKKVSKLYHNNANLNPFNFSKSELSKAGVFGLNQLRTRCEYLLQTMINDIKNEKVGTLQKYKSLE